MYTTHPQYHNKIPANVPPSYGATVNEVADTIIKNVITNYPPTSPVLKGFHSKDLTKHYKALEFLTEALGQFLGECLYIPGHRHIYKEELDNLLKAYVIVNEDNKLCTINENDKAHINKIISLFESRGIDKPSVRTHYDFLHIAEICIPFPKYTFGEILDIPQPDALEEIARKTKASKEETEKINRENQAKNKKILRYKFIINALGNVAVVMVPMMVGIFASCFLYPSYVEKVVGPSCRKYLIPVLAVAGVIGSFKFMDYVGEKELNNPVIPRAFARTYNLKKYYLEIPFRGVPNCYQVGWTYNACVETVEELKAILNGQDPNLVTCLPDQAERSLYIKLARSFFQTIYRMLNDYPNLWNYTWKDYTGEEETPLFDTSFLDKCFRSTERYTKETVKSYTEPDQFPESKMTYEAEKTPSPQVEEVNCREALINSPANKMSA